MAKINLSSNEYAIVFASIPETVLAIANALQMKPKKELHVTIAPHAKSSPELQRAVDRTQWDVANTEDYYLASRKYDVSEHCPIAHTRWSIIQRVRLVEGYGPYLKDFCDLWNIPVPGFPHITIYVGHNLPQEPKEGIFIIDQNDPLVTLIQIKIQ